MQKNECNSRKVCHLCNNDIFNNVCPVQLLFYCGLFELITCNLGYVFRII